MKNSKCNVRNFLFFLSFSFFPLIALCDSAPSGYSPVNAEQLQRALLEAYPDQQVFAFVDDRNKGWRIRRDGEARYYPRASINPRFHTPTRITTISGNTVCFQSLDPTRDLCLEVYQSDNMYFCITRYVNDTSRGYDCEIKFLPF